MGPMEQRQKEIAKAFNVGSDARIAGQPLTSNPYLDEGLAREWRHGWKDVDEHWGELAKPAHRLFMKRLPPVMTACECGCGQLVLPNLNGRPRRFCVGHNIY